jgi:dTMP kinase
VFGNSDILPGFLVFEGLDGSGTTTQLRILGETLSRKGIPHFITAEPTSSPVGRLIREVLSGRETVSRDVLARLFAADRSEHLHGETGMIARARAGELVVCDRYIFSSLAYQGNDLGMETVWNYNRSFPLPSTLIFLDVPPSDGHKRYSAREHLEIYENPGLQEKIRQRYESVFADLKNLPVSLFRIDSRKPISEIAGEVWSIVENLPIIDM